jgi:hypothetical protein
LLWRVTGLKDIKSDRELPRAGWHFFWAAGFFAAETAEILQPAPDFGAALHLRRRRFR